MSTMSKALKHCKTKNSNEKDPINSDNEYTLLPGLPNHLAELCLSTIHPSLLYSVCRPWRRLIYSPSFPPFFSLYALLVSRNQSNTIRFFSLDPISSTWRPLPSPPPEPPLHLLHRHPAFISRNLSIQSLTISGHLLLIAATTHHFNPALPRPLLFDPLTNQWFFGPPLPNPRRWCVTGSTSGTVYVASGVGSHYHAGLARLFEKWDMNKEKKNEWKWEKMMGLKDCRFSREAVEAVGYRGKLCMVNVKGNALKEGAVYDIEKNWWEEMPKGMLAGWTGPAGVEEEEEVMYVVDEAKGALRKYDGDNDCWEDMIAGSDHLKGAKQIAVGRGRICVVCASGGGIAVVDVMATPVRVWVVKQPQDMEVVAVHILPRMILPEE